MRMLATLVLTATLATTGAASARAPAELVGTWELSFDKTGSVCRVLLRAETSDKGDYFLGMPAACRHAMPGLAALGRWSMPDGDHLVLGDPAGAALVTLAATGDAFAGTQPDGRYRLTRAVAGRSVAGSAGLTPLDAPPPAVASAEKPAVLERIATRKSEPAESREDVAGRYAVMREKRDTGCMITLDKARASGGDRAQLAPGCRDQGIVIFDPTAWALAKGELVLTARAGHKTRLEKQGDGQWAKDAKEGGKPLGLKKL